VSGVGVAEAISCLEATAAQSLTGRVAFLHVPQGLSIYLPRSITRDGEGRLRTPAGNVVVVSPGYSGSRIYVTGEVWAALQFVEVRTYTDRSVNTDEAWADYIGVAVFDPC